jgi:hypothetical protein
MLSVAAIARFTSAGTAYNVSLQPGRPTTSHFSRDGLQRRITIHRRRTNPLREHLKDDSDVRPAIATGLGRELRFAAPLERILRTLNIGNPHNGAGLIARIATKNGLKSGATTRQETTGGPAVVFTGRVACL